MHRRTFIKRTATAFAATTLPTWYAHETRIAAATSQSSNDRPKLALIGCGGRGRHITRQAANFGDVMAVCDLDEGRAQAASEQFNNARIFKDYRELLEKAGVDIVLNGTPDHWHSAINIAAMRGGMDVYSEKPLTLTIDEGQKVVQASRETGRILQTGSQQRSDHRFRLACELVRNGRIGRLRHIVTGLPAGPRRGPFQPAPVPDQLDWDLWQGPAPWREYVPERCHGSFRYWYDYSGGTMTDWGAHHNDIALWGLGMERSGPVLIEGKSLVKMIPGGFETAAEYEVHYTYSNGVTHTCKSIRHNDPSGRPIGKSDERHHGVEFQGSDGWIFVTRGKIEASRKELLEEPLSNKRVELYVSNDHMGNFFDCVKSRKQPVCDAEIGHRSVSVCHLGVISIRLQRKLAWDPQRERFVNDPEANMWLARESREPWNRT